ncbi:ribonuclease P [Flavobacterium akiainvivens]|uniref:Ribonuclease P protein component n=1 Tax=Flavobacterium akiainvivens TaxID=1202724 RepID=A0A0M8MIP9_9FLAO|nr:ribonuclease P protein component [Flavobacterium akiainvivens]KOS07031.1 ribonuclease P [Flavobacterium akiainvivens]SFQ58961.1 ribonuclease P protein component [Flavobacterium akiainvivens]
MEKRYTYPKHEKLKSRIIIGSLFEEGKSVSKYPLRLVYAPLPDGEAGPLQMGVSVSKKYFKRAHDRNHFKRLLRESYRLNKHLLLDNLQQPYAVMFFYQTKDRMDFDEVQEKTVLLFEKLIESLKAESQKS